MSGRLNKSDDLVQKLVDMKLKEGKSHYDILRYVQEEHGLTLTSAYNYWNQAKSKIKELVDMMGVDHLTNALTFLEQQKSEALAKGEKRLALDYQKEINKITGLYKENINLVSDKPLKVIWGGQNNKDIQKDDDDWLNGNSL